MMPAMRTLVTGVLLLLASGCAACGDPGDGTGGGRAAARPVVVEASLVVSACGDWTPASSASGSACRTPR